MANYGTLADADDYFANERLDTSAWDAATDAQKQKALNESTKAIDRLNFKGIKTTIDQDLEFPRNGSIDIPNEIIEACYENAYGLLDGKDPEIEYSNLYLAHSSYASVRVSKDTTINQEHIQAGIVSVKAWRYLRPYLADPTDLSLKRV